MIDTNPATLTARQALSISTQSLPHAQPIDDMGVYDHRDAWRALRDAASGDTFLLDDMGGVLFGAEGITTHRITPLAAFSPRPVPRQRTGLQR